MMNPFWLLWLVFLFMFLVAPLGYGWGYRGWGPPYPRYVQRRRATQAAGGDPSSIDHQAWGRSCMARADHRDGLGRLGVCLVALSSSCERFSNSMGRSLDQYGERP
jgi:hypothetical protein